MSTPTRIHGLPSNIQRGMDGEGTTEGEGRRLLGDHWQAGHVTGDDWLWYRMQSHDTMHTHTHTHPSPTVLNTVV